MSKFTDNASEKLLVVAGKISNQKHMASIKNAFYTLMPVILTGAFCTLISNVVCSTTTTGISLAKLPGMSWLGMFTDLFTAANYATLNFFTVAAVFLIGMELAKQNGLGDSPDSGVVAVCSFISVLPTYVVTTVNDVQVTVPNVLGKTVEEAQLMDGVKDIFEIVVKGTQRSDTYEPGQIIQQSPDAGRSRKSNFVIEVYVAAEEEKVPMPNVTGQEYRQARIQLQELNLNLKFDFQSQNSDTVHKDMVISTEPAAGEELTAGQQVTVYVSTGPKTVTVPSFIGQDIAIAIKNAQDMGLTVGQPEFDPYSLVETGRVTEQNIDPNEVVDGGTQIVFTISGSGEEDIVTRTKVAEFALPEDMGGMIKVEFEQDGAIVDSQYISANLQTVTYTFTGQVGQTSLVRAYFTCINDNSAVSSPTQEIVF